MPLSAGARLGPYEIVSLVGTGGMGEVYHARDTRLDRSVAIKIVGSMLSSIDPGGLDHEARAVAALNHPHICALHDVGRERDMAFLVMEYVPGETLAARLERGPLAPRDVVRWSIQIAEALDHAHRHGIVHRDLKPSNIMLTKSGVKVLDFGLATLRKAPPVRMRSPVDGAATLKQPLTPDGTLVGTVPYMAPERLEGHDATVATDLFALGAVMYEMATGQRAFVANSAAGVIAEILRADPPPPSTLRPHLPLALDWVVEKCLAKNPDARWQAAGDVVEVLRWIARTPDRAVVVQRPPRYLVPGAVAALVIAAALAALVWQRWPRSAVEPALLSFEIGPPTNGGFTPTPSSVPTPQFAMSPDGERLAFVASVPPNPPQIWIRALDSVVPAPLAGTQNAEYPFWSADGASLGFFANGMLKRIDIAGGPARTLAPAPTGRGGTWSRDGTILFAPSTSSGLLRVPASGGDPVAVTRLEAGRHEASHRWPQFLPDNRHFIYFVQVTTGDAHRIYYGDLQHPDAGRELLTSRLSASFAAPDYLLFVVEDALMAAHFDWENGRLQSDPFRVVSHVSGSSNFFAAFAVSQTGSLAYASSAATADLGWYARDGRSLGPAVPPGEYVDFRLSPGDGQLAFAEVDPESHRPDLRVRDFGRGTNVRLTHDTATDASPIWSPDGRVIVYRSNRTGIHDLYRKAANGAGSAELLLHTENGKYPTDWMNGGRTIVLHTYRRGGGFDICALDLGSSQPQMRPLVQTPFDEMQAQVSPDGRWLAYTSSESGRPDVFVRSYTDASLVWPVSVGGGFDPRWRGDGRELFYVSPGGTLNAVGFANAPLTSKALFATRMLPASDPYLSNYDVTADGQRFLIKVPVHDVTTAPIMIVTNWLTAAKSAKP